jgi:hypothetical protein
MNHGAQQARGEVLYFVHADTLPPPTFVADIRRAIGQGHEMGCYRFRFSEDHPMLRLNAYFTRFPLMICRGGDQSLFVKRDLFDRLDGYDEHYRIMEEYDFIRRAKKHSHFHIMPGEITVSARKYAHNSYPRVNLANLIVFSMFFLGISQDFMVKTYQRLLDYR